MEKPIKVLLIEAVGGERKLYVFMTWKLGFSKRKLIQKSDGDERRE